MELGALVCTSAAAACDTCPLASRCLARRQGRQEQIPVRTPPPATTFVQESAVVVYRAGRVLLVQRPATGRWASLWEFPHGPLIEGESHDQAAVRLVGELTGLEVVLGTELLTITHGITRYRITLVCFEAEYAGGEFRPGPYVRARWVEPEALSSYPVSAPQRRLARAVAEPGRQRRLF
jgi:A/G-specific adenine glycosylase